MDSWDRVTGQNVERFHVNWWVPKGLWEASNTYNINGHIQQLCFQGQEAGPASEQDLGYCRT